MIDKEIANLAKKQLAKNCYADYIEYTHNGLYKHAKHTRLMCEHLEEVVTGKNLRKIFCLPPRHSKSSTITETFPSYFLGKNPNKRVITTAYGEELANQFGRRNKDKFIQYAPELFGLKISPTKAATQLWEIEDHRGGMLSTQIGSGITGHGADLLIIDDPVKNDAEVASATQRERIWSEYRSTLRTRVHAGGNIIVILTRWHEDDLAGRLLNATGDDWEVISLPAICENENDLLQRKIGEPLWAGNGYDIEWAERTQKEVGSRTWTALYQQRPAPTEGNIIKRTWWQYYTRLPLKFDKIIQSWDLTFKETSNSDYVVGQIWGKVGADTYLIDQWRDRADFVKTQKAIISMTNKYPNATRKYIEEAANGAAIINTLKQSISGIIPVRPTGSKEARVHAITPHIEAGNIYLPSPNIAPWVEEFITECTVFPNGQHDDQVDGMSQALNNLYKAGAMSILK